ncbi:MAG: tRNA (adenosine(37)-N6)-threonylcarbamoyltransferase complex dimerization subunit type 1 TsaB, partial [Proteobacteria bacterium]|nr:tRNA (adenosine(37)-N6)-threonylcarbamoyltransferase complex dimerization subunit type 1 TsaB [Pseudomonadota bacterium]
MKKYFLVIDTSSTLGLCSVADNFNVISEKYINAKSSHSEHLFINIQKVLSESKINFSEIDTVVYTAGPGSFTGLRIAYSAVKGFTVATGVKSHGVSTLKALMYNIREYSGYRVVLIKGSANDVYALIEDDQGDIILNEGCCDIS